MTNAAVQMRRHRPSDAKAVTALRRIVYGDEAVSEELWRWRHEGLGAESGMQVAVVAGTVVGVQPVEIYSFLLDGRPLRGAVLTGVMVHPEHRRRGIFSRLVEAVEAWAWEQGADFVTTMPNDRSRPGFLARSYVDPGPRTLMVRPFAPGRAVWRVLKMAPITSTVDRLTEIGGGLTRRLRRRLRLPAAAPHIEEVDTLDGELADLLASRPPAGLVQHRSHAWLAWRYTSAPGRPYTVLRANDGRRPVGYAVTRLQAWGRLAVGYLVDVVATSDAATTALAWSAAEALRAAGADVVVTVVGGRYLIRRLALAGYVPVPRRLAPKKFYTVYRPHPERATALRALRSIDGWYQTLGDWDTL